MKEIKFSSAQDPASWEPNVSRGDGLIITCLTNEDAKRAAAMFNRLLSEQEALTDLLRRVHNELVVDREDSLEYIKRAEKYGVAMNIIWRAARGGWKGVT